MAYYCLTTTPTTATTTTTTTASLESPNRPTREEIEIERECVCLSTHSRNDSASILYFLSTHPPSRWLGVVSAQLESHSSIAQFIIYLDLLTHPPTYSDRPTFRPCGLIRGPPTTNLSLFLPHVLLITTITKTERERERDGFPFSIRSFVYSFRTAFYTFFFILTLFFLFCADCLIVGFGNKNETSLEPLDDLFLLLLLFCSNNNAMCRSRRAQQQFHARRKCTSQITASSRSRPANALMCSKYSK